MVSDHQHHVEHDARGNVAISSVSSVMSKRKCKNEREFLTLYESKFISFNIKGKAKLLIFYFCNDEEGSCDGRASLDRLYSSINNRTSPCATAELRHLPFLQQCHSLCPCCHAVLLQPRARPRGTKLHPCWSRQGGLRRGRREMGSLRSRMLGPCFEVGPAGSSADKKIK